MKIIGLTGGIGSGKSVVARLFQFMGAAVYDSDHHAKELMSNDILLIHQLKEAFGNEIYNYDKSLQRDLLRNLVFNNPAKLKQLNDIVHTAVRLDFKKWSNEQTAEILLFESALILNKSWIDLFDYLIYVKADESLRIKRIIKRDQLEKDIIKKIMDNQVIDESLLKSSKIKIINNEAKELLIPVVWTLYKELTYS